MKKDNVVYTKAIIPSSDVLMIDGSAGTKFSRILLNGQPAIMLENAALKKKVIITGNVLAGINGWLAQMFRTELKEVTH